MPTQLKEIVPKYVYYERIVGDYTTEDVRLYPAKIADWLDSLDRKTGIIIVDVIHLKTMTSNVFALRQAMIPVFGHPNFCDIVVYGKGDNIMIKFIANNLMPLFRNVSFKLVSNYAQAVDYIYETYPDLHGKLPENPEAII